MDLKEYLMHVLELAEEPAIQYAEEEPAFAFTLEERGKKDD
ncbi:hypothetical protein [Ammoniphilus sp. 3BR4]